MDNIICFDLDTDNCLTITFTAHIEYNGVETVYIITE